MVSIRSMHYLCSGPQEDTFLLCYHMKMMNPTTLRFSNNYMYMVKNLIENKG